MTRALDFILIVVVLSYALSCLAKGCIDQFAMADLLRKQATKVQMAEDAGEFARRFVEILWCILYCIVAWRLIA